MEVSSGHRAGHVDGAGPAPAPSKHDLLSRDGFSARMKELFEAAKAKGEAVGLIISFEQVQKEQGTAAAQARAAHSSGSSSSPRSDRSGGCAPSTGSSAPATAAAAARSPPSLDQQAQTYERCENLDNMGTRGGTERGFTCSQTDNEIVVCAPMLAGARGHDCVVKMLEDKLTITINSSEEVDGHVVALDAVNSIFKEEGVTDALIEAIATRRVPAAPPYDWSRPRQTRHLAIAPPYDWSRTYMAAKDMEEYLPGVPLDATVVEATENGFDVLAANDLTWLVHVAVERQHRLPLRPGDPVVATVDGVGLEGDLLREGRPGEWVVRVRTAGDQQPAEEIIVPASDVTFSWRVGRDMWMKAVRLAPLRLASLKADWLGIGSLEPEIYGSPRALCAGDPAALFGLQDEPELNGQVLGLESSVSSTFMDTSIRCADRACAPLCACHTQGVTLLEKLGSSDGQWRVRLERLGDGDAPMEREVSAAAIGALPNWPFLGVSVACLRAFARAHEALLVDATTEDVCERVCKPLTEMAEDSLAACLVRLGAADPVTGAPLAAAPTIFVSLARRTNHLRPRRCRVCARVVAAQGGARAALCVARRLFAVPALDRRRGHGATALQLGRRLPAHDGRDRSHVPRLRAMAGRGATKARMDALGGAVHSDGERNKGRRVVGTDGAAAAGGVERLSGGARETV
jgi:hypothetical protein